MEVFLRAKVNVEVCHVEDLDQVKTGPKPKAPAKLEKSVSTPKLKTPARPQLKTPKRLLLKPKPISPTKPKPEVIVIDSDSESEPSSSEVDYSQLDSTLKSEPNGRPKEANGEEEPTPRRSTRAKAEVTYRYDVEDAAIKALEEQGFIPGSSSKKRKRKNSSP